MSFIEIIEDYDSAFGFICETWLVSDKNDVTALVNRPNILTFGLFPDVSNSKLDIIPFSGSVNLWTLLGESQPFFSLRGFKWSHTQRVPKLVTMLLLCIFTLLLL